MVMVKLHLGGQLSGEISEQGVTLDSRDVIEEFSDTSCGNAGNKLSPSNKGSRSNLSPDFYEMLSAEAMIRDRGQQISLQRAIEDSVGEYHRKSA